MHPSQARLALGTVLVLGVLLLSGCSTPPRLTAADRRQDIDFLAQWARNCSPFVALNERYKGVPSYEALEPKYLRFAEEARDNAEFYRVASLYFNVIGASGHAYLYPRSMARWTAISTFLGLCDFGMSARQLWAGAGWSRIAERVPWRAHPPFRIVARGDGYFTAEDWPAPGVTVPGGSRIASVNGMDCTAYLRYLRSQTHLRYDAFPKHWADEYLLIIDESAAFRGWQVEFEFPNGAIFETFVPKAAGLPGRRGETQTTDAKDNCTCIELSPKTGYIRIKSMWHGPLSCTFKSYMAKERRLIRDFLSRGRYEQLIIDIRNNGGGTTEYVYENLVRPFLKAPLRFQRVFGLKRKYLEDTKPPVLRTLEQDRARFVIATREVNPPPGFAAADWVFREAVTELKPSRPYRFDGRIFVLVNSGSFSAADDYADLVKRTSLATLVGQPTGGGVGHLLPALIRLPRSGMLFRVEVDLLLTPTGEVNELFGTSPDLALPPAAAPKSITRDDLLKDDWIERILHSPEAP